MTKRWVDKTDYFGPDRRRRPAAKRWGDRRRDNEAGEVPPLGALLRRIRVQMMSPDPEDRRRVLQLLNGAMSEANRLGYRRCSEALQALDRIIREGGSGAVSAAEARLMDAMSHQAACR